MIEEKADDAEVVPPLEPAYISDAGTTSVSSVLDRVSGRGMHLVSHARRYANSATPAGVQTNDVTFRKEACFQGNSPTMKTYSSFALIAALVAFVSPLSFELSVSLFFAAGLGTILLHDYVRSTRALHRPRAQIVHVARASCEVMPRFELAA